MLIGSVLKLPFGGYFALGVCNDANAMIELAMQGATSLYPLTRDRPEALLPVGDRPMADWLLDRVEPIGFDAKYVVTNARFFGQFRVWAEGKDVTVVDDGTTSDDDLLGAIGDMRRDFGQVRTLAGYDTAHQSG